VLDHTQYHLDHPARILPHIIVPEPHNPPALSFEPGRAPFVVFGRDVLAAIHLDHQPQLDAGKIGNERTDRMLAAEFVSSKAPIAQKTPKGALGICLMGAKVSGVVVRHAATMTGRE
jgi:hypothetical protein